VSTRDHLSLPPLNAIRSRNASGSISREQTSDKGRYRQHREMATPETFQAMSHATEIRVDHSLHLEASVCFRCTAPWSAQKRDRGETESVPVPLHNHGTISREDFEACATGLYSPGPRKLLFPELPPSPRGAYSAGSVSDCGLVGGQHPSAGRAKTRISVVHREVQRILLHEVLT
jgi:hypothetical protein